jgi:hypothetical protein
MGTLESDGKGPEIHRVRRRRGINPASGAPRQRFGGNSGLRDVLVELDRQPGRVGVEICELGLEGHVFAGKQTLFGRLERPTVQLAVRLVQQDAAQGGNPPHRPRFVDFCAG